MLSVLRNCTTTTLSHSRRMSTQSIGVTLELRDRKGIITMDRPKALNALSLPMIRTMEPALREWHEKNSTDLVLLKACEGKAFCAGGDVKAIAQAKSDKDSFFREEYVVDFILANMKSPLVSLIDGIVMGGGCGIAFHGKFSVVSEKALFAMPETAIGLFPDVGGCHFLSRLKNNLGVFLGLTGNRLKGADILHAGLVSHYVPSNSMPELEKNILELKNCSEQSIQEVIERFQSNPSEFSLKPHLEEIEDCFGVDTVEEIFEKLESRNSEFARKQIELLKKMSPLSLKVSLKAIQKAKNLDLTEVFKMDLRLCKRFLDDHDFYEGVDALLIRKTNDPKWKPSSLKECTNLMVDKYFEKLQKNEELVLKL